MSKKLSPMVKRLFSAFLASLVAYRNVINLPNSSCVDGLFLCERKEELVRKYCQVYCPLNAGLIKQKWVAKMKFSNANYM